MVNLFRPISPAAWTNRNRERIAELEGIMGKRKCCIRTTSSLLFPVSVPSYLASLLCCPVAICCPCLCHHWIKCWTSDCVTETKIDLVKKAVNPIFTCCTNPSPPFSDEFYYLTAPERQEMDVLKMNLDISIETAIPRSDSDSDSDFELD